MPFFQIPDEIEAACKPYVLSVDRYLDVFNSPTLDRFKIHLWLPTSCTYAESKANSKTADRWLRFAGLRSVRKLTVWTRTRPSEWKGRIPCSLFCCRALTHLQVDFSTFPSIPSKFQGFRNLRKLLLFFASISQDALTRLLGLCPFLEDLKLIGCRGPTFVKISRHNLPKLMHFLFVSHHYESTVVSIEAPNLRSIHFNGDLSRLDWAGSSALMKAFIVNDGEDLETLDDWMRLVRAVTNVSVLTVNDWFFQFEIQKDYLIGPMFKNLKELNCELKWITSFVLRSLTFNFGECPFLEKLCINLSREARSAVKDSVQEAYDKDPRESTILRPFEYIDAVLNKIEDEHEGETWDPSKHLGELDYCLCHLKTITLDEFLGSKNEMHLSKILLEKTTTLEKFIVFDCLQCGDQRHVLELYELFATIP